MLSRNTNHIITLYSCGSWLSASCLKVSFAFSFWQTWWRPYPECSYLPMKISFAIRSSTPFWSSKPTKSNHNHKQPAILQTWTDPENRICISKTPTIMTWTIVPIQWTKTISRAEPEWEHPFDKATIARNRFSHSDTVSNCTAKKLEIEIRINTSIERIENEI